MRAASHQSVFLLILVGLIALTWVVLWLWEQSPYGRYLNHAELARLDVAQGFAPLLQQGGLYVVGWTLMLVAMMLPTSLPLVQMFRRMTRTRRDHGQLVMLLLVGYIGVWLVCGVVLHAFDLGLHELVEDVLWLETNAWVFGAGVLLLAGAFQFSSLKYRCLDKCRAPLSFLNQHWRGRAPARHSFLLGAHHGLFCVGCCWALMFVMFAVGTGSVGWMLALGAVMAIEKNLPWGRRLSAPLGAALILWGGLIIINHSWLWQTLSLL